MFFLAAVESSDCVVPTNQKLESRVEQMVELLILFGLHCEQRLAHFPKVRGFCADCSQGGQVGTVPGGKEGM